MQQVEPTPNQAFEPELTPAGNSKALGDPIRLLKVMTLFACGGTEVQVMNLTRNLDRERYDISFACLRKYGQFLGELEEMQIPVTEFPIDSLYKPNTFRQLLRLSQHIRKQKIQIVHSYNFYANMFAIPAAKMAGVPLVVASVRDRGVYLDKKQRVANRMVLSMADRILVNAESIKDWLLDEGLSGANIGVIPNGLDMSRFEQGDGDSDNAIRREFSIPLSSPLVMMLSRLNPQKGVDDFIKAAALVVQKHPAARFMIVGEKIADGGNGMITKDQAYHDQLQQLVDDHGLQDSLIFAGHRDDIPALLSEANVSVLPSHNEGLSNTLIESLAAGAPIVTTRVGGNPEVVKDGENGLLVPVQDAPAVAEAICRLLEDAELSASMMRANRQRARDVFSIDRMVQDTDDFYHRELNGGSE